MTFVFISCDSTEWLVFLLTSVLTHGAASRLGPGASPNVVCSSWVSLQNGRRLQRGTGGSLGLSCGPGFGIHTAAVQPRPLAKQVQASPDSRGQRSRLHVWMGERTKLHGQGACIKQCTCHLNSVVLLSVGPDYCWQRALFIILRLCSTCQHCPLSEQSGPGQVGIDFIFVW